MVKVLFVWLSVWSQAGASSHTAPLIRASADGRGLGTHRTKGSTGAALALEGGGYRALSCDAGLIAGLLAACVKSNASMCSPSIFNSGLLDRFGIVSSVSGSSWFAAELIYSKRFVSLVEGIAAAPQTATAQFNQQWMGAWLSATRVNGTAYNLLLTLVRKLLGALPSEDLQLFLYFRMTGLTWDNWVKVLLESTSGITGDVLMGSLPTGEVAGNADVDEAWWASGKTFLVDHAVLMPAKTRGELATIARGALLPIPRVGYVADGALSDPPLYIPAVFSVTVGTGVNSSAPVPYVSPTAVDPSLHFRYSGVEIPLILKPSGESTPLVAFGGNFTASGGATPLINAVSASSAFLGNWAVGGRLEQEVAALLGAEFTPWAVSEGGSKAFQQAGDLIKRLVGPFGVNTKSVDALADAKIRGVVDAGFTDGTGIAHAVAAGATDVLVVLNSNATNDATYVERMFLGGYQPDVDAAPLFPVFGQPSGTEVARHFETFHTMEIPASSKFLKLIAVGVIEAVTVNNSFFGVEGGRHVTLSIVNIGSSLTIGGTQDFYDYGTLLQEIVETLISDANIPFVRDVFLPLFRETKPDSQRSESSSSTSPSSFSRSSPLFV
eukprot:TRINITY_DN30100_c0_g1_i1.p1 TRINITY_DN30100_c0_g1~~TRINITY_DN30100_c0_g1_i1.p1  ORF type:complete len:624 (+),score=90.95 TRINITY_DN30100_c0_g1_i1:47-1873(+)